MSKKDPHPAVEQSQIETPEKVSKKDSQKMVGGFQVEEPAPVVPLPLADDDGTPALWLCGTGVSKFERHDFVEAVYNGFRSLVQPILDTQEVVPKSFVALRMASSSSTLEFDANGSSNGCGDRHHPTSHGHHQVNNDSAAGIIPSGFEQGRRAGLSLTVIAEAIAKALDMSLSSPLNADFGTLALLDFYLELLYLGLTIGMSSIQMQQALLLSKDTIADVSWMERESDMEGKVVPGLNLRLSRLCNPRQAAVVETTEVTEVEYEERIDPIALAQFEQAKKEAKGKKKDQMSEANLPRIQVAVEVRKLKREPKVVVKPPYFNTREVLALLNFYKSTLFQHWRLYNTVVSSGGVREVNMVEFKVAIEDVAIECVPLAQAITEEEYLMKLARESIFEQYEAEALSAFQEWQDDIATVENLFNGEDAAARVVWEREVAEDKDQKMDVNGYHRTVEVLKRRVAKKAKEEGDRECSPESVAERPRAAFKLDDDWTGSVSKRMEALDAALVKAAQPEPAAAGKGRK